MALLRGAAAVLQPSRFEGWSTIIEDAKSLGKPIVASDIAVHREQLDGEQSSLLPLDDAAIWADAILDVANIGGEQGPEQPTSFVTGQATEAAQRTGRAFIGIMREAMSR